MSDDKAFRVVGPYPRDSDPEILEWLAREAAEQKMASDGYEIVEYHQRELALTEVPATALKHMLALGLNPDDFVWIELSGIGRVNRPVLDWLVAECKWQSEQLKLWIAAERTWEAANALRV